MNEADFRRIVCAGGEHCKPCRDPIVGLTIRRKWSARYGLGGDDFACWAGGDWHKPPPASSLPAREVADLDCGDGPAVIEPLAFEQWPLVAKAFARGRAPGDQGVGDTIHRLTGRPGELISLGLDKLWLPCGCGNRWVRWNVRYPYAAMDAAGIAH